MTDREAADRVTRAAARAAENTAGVAFLRPGLAELVRGRAPSYPGGAAGTGRRVGGVRARLRGGDPASWHLELHLAVRDGHRALDVTRAVRAAVTAEVMAAVRTEQAPGPVRVSVAVTVTDIA